MKKYCIGIDVGTTAIKGVLADENMKAIARARREHGQSYPEPGFSEQDPEELCASALAIIKSLLENAGIGMGDVSAIGIDHQGETCLIWDRRTGKPVYPAITWQDRRASAEAKELRELCGERIQAVTGLMPDSYYSALKLRWILDHTADGRRRAQSGELLAGTLNTYILWKLSGKRIFATDVCSAGCTMLFDPRENEWSHWLLELMDIPRTMLPDILPCDALFGHTDGDIAGGCAPIWATLPDSNAGMAGIGAARPGFITTTYGTGNFMHLVTGEAFAAPADGLTASCCLALRAKRLYQLNGICYTAGSAVKWLKDGLNMLEDESVSSEIACGVPDSNGVFFVPALSGLATPYWNETARGAILGLTAGVNSAHIVRAVLESIAAQVATVYERMKNACASPVQSMFALGGMTANAFLMQYQADLMGLPLVIPSETEPAFGAARMAMASALGLAGPDELETGVSISKIYEPSKGEDWRKERLEEWNSAVARCL
ncbi:MAG TPA: FGGY family carbohydrate kinase [Clostridia bacterium]|nr:FGGY family carbohydrate kinase [Clostridia bacterium]